MTKLAVTRLGPEDAALVRELRLELLAAFPTNFSADPEFEKALTLQQWEERLSAPGRHWFLCRVDGAIAGICAFSRVTHTRKEAHRGDLGSMYVRAAYQGQGVAEALLKAVFDVAQETVEQISLAVNAENARAVAFYKRMGFRECGRMPRAIKVDGRYYDEMEMVRFVSTSD
jgi:RimJ/RimL family protein N-acetyltransferase